MDCVLGEILWSGLQTKDTILAAAIEQQRKMRTLTSTAIVVARPRYAHKRAPPLLWTVELEARFAGPKTDLEIKHAREQGIPKKKTLKILGTVSESGRHGEITGTPRL